MSRSADPEAGRAKWDPLGPIRQPTAPGSARWRAAVYCYCAALMLGQGDARAQKADPAYWLGFGRSVQLCPGAKADVPFKVEGASWGILASGVVLCRDAGETYVFTVDYLNVAIDPSDRGLIKRDVVGFDWLGLALYRPGPDKGVTWLYDQPNPVKADLRRDSPKRVVFGHLGFTVPKREAEQASNMLFYLTFDGPLVAIHAL